MPACGGCSPLLEISLLLTFSPRSFGLVLYHLRREMMRRIFAIGLLSFFSFSAMAATHVVTTPGFVFSPATLNVAVGDTIIFELGGSHNAVEVSQATYNAGGSTPLAGGFSTGFGGGQVVIGSAGTHYYVCQPHAGAGMKATITASPSTRIAGVKRQDNPMTAKVIGQKLNITFGNAETGSVSIFDLLGNKLFESPANDELSVSLNNFKTGVYFVVLNDQKGRFTHRFSYRRED